MDPPSPFAVCWDVAGKGPFIFKSSCVGYLVVQAGLLDIRAFCSVSSFSNKVLSFFTFIVKIMTFIRKKCIKKYLKVH